MVNDESDHGLLDAELIRFINKLPSDILQQRDELRARVASAATTLKYPEVTLEHLDEATKSLVFAGYCYVIGFSNGDLQETHPVVTAYDVVSKLAIRDVGPKAVDPDFRHGAELAAISNGLAKAFEDSTGTRVDRRTPQAMKSAISFQSVAHQALEHLTGGKTVGIDQEAVIFDNRVHPFLTEVFPSTPLPTPLEIPLATEPDLAPSPSSELGEPPSRYEITLNPKPTIVRFVPKEGVPFQRTFYTDAKGTLAYAYAVFQASVDQGYLPWRTARSISNASGGLVTKTAVIQLFGQAARGITVSDKSPTKGGLFPRISPQAIRRIVETDGDMTIELENDHWEKEQETLKRFPSNMELPRSFEVVVKLSDIDPSSFQNLKPFSPREDEILSLFANGNDHKAIAKQLGISPDTVVSFYVRIRKKLGLSNMTELEQWTREQNYGLTPASVISATADQSAAPTGPESPQALVEPPTFSDREQSIINAARNGAATQGQIARDANIPRGSISHEIRRLEGRTGMRVGELAEKYVSGIKTEPIVSSPEAAQPASTVATDVQQPPEEPSVEPLTFTERDISILRAYGNGAKNANEVARLAGTTVGNVYTYSSKLRGILGTQDLAAAALHHGFGPKSGSEITPTSPISPTIETAQRVSTPPKPSQRTPASVANPDQPIRDEPSRIISFKELEARVLQRIGELGDQYSLPELAKELGKSSETTFALLQEIRRNHGLANRDALIKYAQHRMK